MACPASLTIEQESEGDTPLFQAIYLSGLDKIIGIHGQWLYKFNASTGAKEAELRWAPSIINEAYICNIGNTVYVSAWRGVIENYRPFPYDRPYRNVYAVNASTMLVTGLIDVAINDDAPYSPDFYQGFRNIITDGTLLYGWNGSGLYWRMNPANTATYTTFDDGDSHNSPLIDMLLETTNGLVWTTNNSTAQKAVSAFDITNLSAKCRSTPLNGPTDPNPVGITFDPVHNRIYGVQGDADVFSFDASAVAPPAMNNFGWTRLSILQAAATPVRIKYNSVDGLIYVPGWASDQVEVLNPSTNTITAVKTGFTAPFDVVFTPLKKFAVQNSSVGLREIV